MPQKRSHIKNIYANHVVIRSLTERSFRVGLVTGDSRQSVTYRYREFPVPGIFHFFGGIGTGIGKYWYRKKVSEPVSEKFGTGKSLGTGIGKIWYRKKVPVSVSKIFGTGKKYW